MDLIPRYEGIYRAVVKYNQDPKNLRRIRVVVPQITGDQVTDWIWPVISTKRPPKVGSGAWVMYIGGNPDYPVWIGEFGEEPQGVFSYGAFNSTQDQTIAVINTAYAMTFNNTDYSEGVLLKNNSELHVEYNGTYNIQFSAQVKHRTGGGGGVGNSLWIWFRKNGSNIVNSATSLNVQSGNYTVAAWNFLIDLKKGDYAQIMWAADNTSIALEYEAASGSVPAIPSVIVSMNQIA